MNKSILHRLFASIPIIGPALAIFLEHVEGGIAAHGKLIGFLRGLVTGLVIMVTLIAMSEAAFFTFDLGRYWLALQYGDPLKARMRAKISDENEDKPTRTDDPLDPANQPHQAFRGTVEKEIHKELSPQPVFTTERAK